MKLILKEDEFTQDAAKSVYNNNYYKHDRLGYTIREVCNEECNIYVFYLIEDEREIYLGYSYDGFVGLEFIEINFKNPYT